MKVIESRCLPGVAELHVAQLAGGHPRFVEFVDTSEPGVPKARKWVIQVAVQAGCPIGCAHCDGGSLGFWGNLTADEILGQVHHVLGRNASLDPAAHPKLKVHLSRLGEPTLNPSVLVALRRLRIDLPGPGLIACLSTVAPRTPRAEAFLDELKRLKDELFPRGSFQLQFSLHATDEATRKRIVPVRSWGFERMARFGAAFRRPGDRKVTLAFAPPPGAELDADAIASAFDPAHFLAKVTPLSPTAASDARGLTNHWLDAPAGVLAFAEALGERGFETVVSPPAPAQASSDLACGQLWSPRLREEARTHRANLERDAAAYVRAADLPERAKAWRAALPAAPRPAARAAALLVVGMGSAALEPRSPRFVPEARAVMHNVLRLLLGLRAAGRAVAFADEAGGGPVAPLLAPVHGEPVLRYGPGGPLADGELAPWLRRSGAQALVLCGLGTDTVLAPMAGLARRLGFDACIALDASAASREDSHLAGLKEAVRGGAAAAMTEEILSSLARPAIQESMSS